MATLNTNPKKENSSILEDASPFSKLTVMCIKPQNKKVIIALGV
jgi:hypothetical protein